MVWYLPQSVSWFCNPTMVMPHVSTGGKLGVLWKNSSIALKLFQNKVFKNCVFFLMRIKGGTAFHILGPHKLILPDCLILPKFFTAPVTQAKNLGVILNSSLSHITPSNISSSLGLAFR